MLRSVKSQIILATSLIIVAILSATAFLVISQKTREINQDIFNKALSFAELTNERIVSNYENNYKKGAFANFDREMADIYSLNKDITGIAIYNYKGETLYEAPAIEAQGSSVTKKNPERIQAVIPSVETLEGRIVYLEKMPEGMRFTDFNGQEVPPIDDTEEIRNVIYPFRDQSNINRDVSLDYAVTYDALSQRIRSTALHILAIAFVGIVTALLIGYLVAGSITKPIKTLTEGASKIGQGELKVRIPIKSKSEVGMLANTFNKMAADLEKSTKVMIEKEKLSRELELAAQIQQDFLPKTLPKTPGLDIAASLNAATEVGGDCYDFIPMNKSNKLLFYVADVTGHGVGAGLVSAISNALVPSLMDYHDTTEDIIIHLNRILKMKTAPSIFVTCVMALWDYKKNSLEFTQAGHDPILHYHAKSGDVTELAYGGVAMGMIDDISSKVTTNKTKSEKGDVFLLYTDGIPESWKNKKENFGMGRLKDSFKKYASQSAQKIHDGILKDVREFSGNYPQMDDITLMVIKRVD